MATVGDRSNVGLIRLNRPQVLNALSGGLMSELVQALAHFDADGSIAATVITGEGKAFAGKGWKGGRQAGVKRKWNPFLTITNFPFFTIHFYLQWQAGADIKEMTSRTFAGLVTGKFRSNFAALQSTKPLIAAVNGYAVSSARKCQFVYFYCSLVNAQWHFLICQFFVLFFNFEGEKLGLVRCKQTGCETCRIIKQISY